MWRYALGGGEADGVEKEAGLIRRFDASFNEDRGNWAESRAGKGGVLTQGQGRTGLWESPASHCNVI